MEIMNAHDRARTSRIPRGLDHLGDMARMQSYNSVARSQFQGQAKEGALHEHGVVFS